LDGHALFERIHKTDWLPMLPQEVRERFIGNLLKAEAIIASDGLNCRPRSLSA